MGRTKTIKVNPDVDLSNIKKGEDVDVRATKGLALLVEGRGGQPKARFTGMEGRRTGEMMLDTSTATATVESVDPEKREITIKGPEGNTKTFHLDKASVNFDQIKVGDKIKATLAEDIAVAVSKGGGMPAAGEGVLVVKGERGGKPGFLVANTEIVTGKVDSVDAQNHTIALTDAQGKRRTFKA